jgi:hypothetical protein
VDAARAIYDDARSVCDEYGTLPSRVDDLRGVLFMAQRWHYKLHTGGWVAPVADPDADFEVTGPPAHVEEPLVAFMRAIVANIPAAAMREDADRA